MREIADKLSNRYSRIVALVAIPLICFLFYAGPLRTGKLNTQPNPFNYFKELSISFLEGRLDIDCPGGTRCHDLALFEGKYYFYQPPMPLVFVLPTVLIWGRGAPDSLITSLLAALNVFLLVSVYFSIREKYTPGLADGRPVTGGRGAVWYALLWGLGTVQCYMAILGDIWHLSQVAGQSFLLLSIRSLLPANITNAKKGKPRTRL